MSGDINERFTSFLHTIQLQDIRPMELHSKASGSTPPQGSGLQLEWRYAFAKGDPIASQLEIKVFRPKYEFNIKFNGSIIFEHTSKFIISFKVINAEAYEQLWAEEDLRKAFMEQQIQKTLWPLLRQHIHDGMSRLGLSPVTLPWVL